MAAWPRGSAEGQRPGAGAACARPRPDRPRSAARSRDRRPRRTLLPGAVGRRLRGEDRGSALPRFAAPAPGCRRASTGRLWPGGTVIGPAGGRTGETRAAGASSLHQEDDDLPAQKASDRESTRGSTGVSEDAELVRRASAGDRGAFEALVLRYETPLRKLVYGYVLNWEVAEDVAQDAFLLAFRKLDNLGESAAFKSWLYRIAINRAHDELRRSARWGRRLDRNVGEEALAELPAAGAESAVESRLLRRALVRELARLPKSQRTAVVLKDVVGMKYVEIAECLGCPIGTAQIRVHRGRQKLRRRLGEPGSKAGGGTG
ncbi:MAG: sigma-70 family RNA polymerase sigma factor [Holophagales bacterium]|nr:sigma-70 family RNA polymerase sigma factor [Holophagales bacterium]MYH26495.1 sigma-70 family RNA polymerase sigma factor [Holophagales bacterium]